MTFLIYTSITHSVQSIEVANTWFPFVKAFFFNQDVIVEEAQKEPTQFLVTHQYSNAHCPCTVLKHIQDVWYFLRLLILFSTFGTCLYFFLIVFVGTFWYL